jgi:type I restriction enzyme R subunit
MAAQTEAALELELMNNLERDLGYELVKIAGEQELVENLRIQLEVFNDISFTDNEWVAVLNHLKTGKIFEKAEKLRGGWTLRRDDGSTRNIHFIDIRNPLKNHFQVTNQITMNAKYQNRYDVTILINGLPLVHIELKKSGIAIKEAFNQVNRYRRQTFSSGLGLFEYVQMFIISNGANTKYYANTVGFNHSEKSQSFKFTSFWADEQNNIITELKDFASAFLNRAHLANMLTQYSVLTTQKQILMLRPYQIYAIKRILDRAKLSGDKSRKGGYIWHTTGSGKTLTSFKASQLLTEIPNIDKVVFCVDRNDLDAKTIRQFNEYRENSVDTTDSTTELVKQFGDPNCKLIVTTIQKLGNAISRSTHKKNMESAKSMRVVFIFDECHRSQFGETHQKITSNFKNYQLFGFTGTPIFAENAAKGVGGVKQTTKDLFGEKLHEYVITDAIKDDNVLKFSVEQLRTYREKADAKVDNINVEDIDRPEVMESEERIRAIMQWVLQNHTRKTHGRQFNAILAAPNVATAIKYMDAFSQAAAQGITAHAQGDDNSALNQAQGNAEEGGAQGGESTPLKIATVFSYGVNEDDKNADSDLGDIEDNPDVDENAPVNEHTREALERFIGQYNDQFGTNHSTTSQGGFRAYQMDISRRLERTEIDILVVVNMFLTGFDAPKLNTLYVDKNLRYHGLIQAYSRTNRILNETKSYGNIVCFRNLKANQDDALALFANKLAADEIFRKPYEEVLGDFKQSLQALFDITAESSSVDLLQNEDDKKVFVLRFRELLKLKNVLSTESQFTLSDFIDEQVFANFQSKYLDLYESTKEQKETVSILDEVDFEIELTYKAQIDVSYILRLLGDMLDAKTDEDKAKIRERVMAGLGANEQLRSKRELVEDFIENQLRNVMSSEDLPDDFDEFMRIKFEEQIAQFAHDNDLDENKLQSIIESYQFSRRMPLDKTLRESMNHQPSILQQNSILKNLKSGLVKMFKMFVD